MGITFACFEEPPCGGKDADDDLVMFCTQCEDMNLLHQRGCRYCHQCGSILKVRSGSRIYCEEYGGGSFENAYESDENTHVKKIVEKRLPYTVAYMPSPKSNHDESEDSAFPHFLSQQNPIQKSKHREQLYSITAAVMTKESQNFPSSNIDSDLTSDPLNMPPIRQRRQISLAQNFNLEELNEDFIAALRDKIGISNLEDLLVATQDDIEAISAELNLSLAEKLRFRRSVLTEQRLLSISNSLRSNSFQKQSPYSPIEIPKQFLYSHMEKQNQRSYSHMEKQKQCLYSPMGKQKQRPYSAIEKQKQRPVSPIEKQEQRSIFPIKGHHIDKMEVRDAIMDDSYTGDVSVYSISEPIENQHQRLYSPMGKRNQRSYSPIEKQKQRPVSPIEKQEQRSALPIEGHHIDKKKVRDAIMDDSYIGDVSLSEL